MVSWWLPLICLFYSFLSVLFFGQSWFLKNVPFSHLFQNQTHWGLCEQTLSSRNSIAHAKNVGEEVCISCKPFFNVNKRKGQVKNSPVAQIGKESASNAGDLVSIPGLGRSPGEGNGHPLQYSCLENSMNRKVWQAIVHRVAKSWKKKKKIERLTYTFKFKWGS